MITLRTYIFLFLSLFVLKTHAVTYTKQDSIKVVTLLKEALNDKPSNFILYYGKKLEGVPYVAHTLEVNKKEELIVNMRQMDCTTFVETVMALSMTSKAGSVSWHDYLYNLQTIRYRNGKPEGYTSRNHYFLWWVEQNSAKGIIKDVLPTVSASQKKHLRRQTININYMTQHSSAYAMLKGNKQDINTIAAYEKQSKGKTMLYLPAQNTSLSRTALSFIQDGDILAIATKKTGLDTTHIGFAFWGKDGKLHLLNASQVHKKVVFEPMSLRQYMQKHPTQIGVWVLHPTF